MARCNQEMCPMWDGDGCPCDAFGLDPDDLPTDGIFTTEGSKCHNLQGTWVSPRAAWEPGRSEGEIKAEALREAADWFSGPLPDGTPNGRAYNSYRVAWILQERAASLDPADQVTDTEGSKS